LPDTGLVPDLSASKNILGWNVHEGQIYLTCGPSPRSEIALAKAPAPHLSLQSASAAVEVSRFEERAISLKATDLRRITITLAGLAPSAGVDVTVNGQVQHLMSGTDGRLAIPGGNMIDLQVEGAPLP